MTIERILLDPAAEKNPISTDELAEGTTNKYDTGVPPTDTDELPEGASNKYDTGVPPSDLEELPDGATRKAMMDAEKTKLSGVEENAKDDQTGAEIRDSVVALPELERKIVLTDPKTGEFKVTAVQVDADGKVAVDKDDVAIP